MWSKMCDTGLPFVVVYVDSRITNDRLFCLARLQILILMNERYSRLLLTKGIVHRMISVRLLWRASSAEEDAHDIHVHVVDVRVVFFVKIQISTYVGSKFQPIFVSYEIRRRHLIAFPFGGHRRPSGVCLSSIR